MKSQYPFLIFLFLYTLPIAAQNFYLDENGVTIKCENCQPGDTGTVNGILYEAVDRTLLEQRRDEGADLTILCTSLVTETDSLFDGILSFNQNISTWDVSNVTDMSRMFAGGSRDDKTSFNQDIGFWDVGNVTDMEGMFNNSTFNQDISSWNVGNVKNMTVMFWNAYSFNSDIGSWDMINVTKTFGMFRSARSFNKDIGSWDVNNVTDMNHMFAFAESFNQDLSSWCVENIPSEPESFAVDCPIQPDFYPIWGTCPSPVILSEIECRELFDIYPNPTNTLLTIETEIFEVFHVDLSSLNGQLILSRKMEGPTHQLDLSPFQKGIYFITIRSKDFVTTKKIIKL